MLKKLYIIVGLDMGGAEIMLKRLILSDPGSITATAVISLTTLGEIGESLRARGVIIHALGMKTPMDFFDTLSQLIKLIRRYRPAIVHTLMYHANLMGGLAACLAGDYKVVWGLHSTSIPQGPLSFTYWLVRLCALFSYFIPNKIICCSESARIAHINLYFAEHKMIVIPNGYDFSALEFNIKSRTSIRRELGISDFDILIGVVGRFDPLKDFHSFVMAASSLTLKFDKVKFLMVGRGNEWSNRSLRGWIDYARLTESFQLVGHQSDVAGYLSAMDVFCLSSVSEAFPNVVVEAMAIGLPCVVTQAGDAALILDDDEFVVPVKDVDALAKALLKMCHLDSVERKVLGEKNARKVRSAYRIEKIREAYDEIFFNQVAR